MPEDPEPFLTSTQVAAQLGVVPEVIRRWTADGRIECVKTFGGHRRYRQSEIDRILTERTSKVRPS
jgi:excisionase family DNA binding protein